MTLQTHSSRLLALAELPLCEPTELLQAVGWTGAGQGYWDLWQSPLDAGAVPGNHFTQNWLL